MPVTRLSCSSAPRRPRYAPSTRPPIEPVSPSCFVVCRASKTMSKTAQITKRPASPCVSHGAWIWNHVCGIGPGGGTGRLDGTACGMAPLGMAGATAVGMTVVFAAAASNRGFIGGILFTTAGADAPAGAEENVPESERLSEPLRTVVPIKNRRVWRDLARILSTCFNPFLTALALFVILAHIGARDTLEFWRLLFLST